MKKTKILAGILAAASVASFASCSDSSSGDAETTTTTEERTEWTGDNIEVDVDNSALDADIDINGKSLKWMAYYDLNPTNSEPERSTEVSIFEDTYGAKIEWIPTTVGTEFDDLATAILGGDPPDLVRYTARTFPYDVSQARFQSVDSLVDWDDPMWAEMKPAADTFMWNGEHYVAPVSYKFNDFVILMYNKTRVEEEGLDDPYELFLEDKWDWTAFTNIMKTYVDNGSDRYGICGYWEDSFCYTSGDTLVTYDGSKFTNNLYSNKIERAMGILEDLKANDLIKRGWYERDVFDNGGETLFCGLGTWAFPAVVQAYPNDEIQIVPFPRDPEQDQYYMAKEFNAYMWVKGSDNADCVKVWYDVCRLVNYDTQYTDVTKAKSLQNGWPEDQYDLVTTFADNDKFHYSYDVGYGISPAMAGDSGYIRALYTGIKDDKFESWVQGREEYMNIIDSELAVYN